MFDTLITNSTVYNGLNEPPQFVDVGIKEGKIAAIGNDLDTTESQVIVDGTGLLLSPGFIDPHASTGFGYFFPQAADHKLYQGITTEIFGNCGTSPAPIAGNLVPTMERLSNQIGFPFCWRSMAEYFEAIRPNLQFNIATLVGHSTLRGSTLSDWTTVTKENLLEMETALAKSMDEGALGFSTGLIYEPGCFAGLDELIRLAKVAKEKGGIYASHIRNERDKIEEAVDEALTIGKEAQINVLISHLKAAEKPNWGKIPKIIERLKQFNAENETQVVVDVYPYTAVSTKLKAFIPKYILKKGHAAMAETLANPKVVADIADWIELKQYDLDQMLVISDEFEEFAAKTVAQIAKNSGKSLAQTIANILKKSVETWIVYHCINEDDMDCAVLWEKSMICTDSWSYPINAPKTIGQPHPRSYGAFTTYLERYVLKNNQLSWQEAIHKVSYLPAKFFGLEKRGAIKEGYHADLVLFDPKAIKANANYIKPRQLSSGVVHLWVNGSPVIENGKMQEKCPGKVLTIRNKSNEAVCR